MSPMQLKASPVFKEKECTDFNLACLFAIAIIGYS